MRSDASAGEHAAGCRTSVWSCSGVLARKEGIVFKKFLILTASARTSSGRRSQNLRQDFICVLDATEAESNRTRSHNGGVRNADALVGTIMRF